MLRARHNYLSLCCMYRRQTSLSHASLVINDLSGTVRRPDCRVLAAVANKPLLNGRQEGSFHEAVAAAGFKDVLMHPTPSKCQFNKSAAHRNVLLKRV